LAADDSILGRFPWGFIFSVVELSWQEDRVGQARSNADRQEQTKVYIEKKTGVTFADVAGIDEAEEEVAEVVGFLKDPENIKDWAAVFQRRLNRRPRAREKLCLPARRGEAGVPFSALRALTSSRCSSASAQQGSGIFLCKR